MESYRESNVEDKIDADIILATILRRLDIDLNIIPNTKKLIDIYTESFINDGGNFQTRKGTYSLFVCELLRNKQKERICEEILEMLHGE